MSRRDPARDAFESWLSRQTSGRTQSGERQLWDAFSSGWKAHAAATAPAAEGASDAKAEMPTGRGGVVGREDIKITLCVPFPDGKPLCALCGEPRITHATVFEMKMPDGMAGRGFGALCDDCAAPYVADVQGNPEAN